MEIVRGRLHQGNGDFSKRMTQYVDVFTRATGEKLFPGTLNVQLDRPIEITEHFRIRGAEINEPQQDLLFEICRANGQWAYRIRPCNVNDGSGGHGDHIIEIACVNRLRKADGFNESSIEIGFFR